MKKNDTGFSTVLLSAFATAIVIGGIASCSGHSSRSLPLRVVFTTEVQGYLEPCG